MLHLRKFCDTFNSSTLKCSPDPSKKSTWTNSFLGMMINLGLLPYLLFPISKDERMKYSPDILEDHDEKTAMVFLLLMKSIDNDTTRIICLASDDPFSLWRSLTPDSTIGHNSNMEICKLSQFPTCFYCGLHHDCRWCKYLHSEAYAIQCNRSIERSGICVNCHSMDHTVNHCPSGASILSSNSQYSPFSSISSTGAQKNHHSQSQTQLS